MMTARAVLAVVLALGLAGCGESDTRTSDNEPSETREIRQVAEAPETAPSAEADAETAAEEAGTQTAEAAAKEEAEVPSGPAPLAFRSAAGELRLDGTRILDAIVSTDDSEDGWFVFVQMDAETGVKFFELSSESVGEPISVLVNGEVVSEPVVETAISGGGFLIDVESAEEAESIVKAITLKDEAG